MYFRGTWVTQWGGHPALDLGVVGSSPVLGPVLRGKFARTLPLPSPHCPKNGLFWLFEKSWSSVKWVKCGVLALWLTLRFVGFLFHQVFSSLIPSSGVTVWGDSYPFIFSLFFKPSFSLSTLASPWDFDIRCFHGHPDPGGGSGVHIFHFCFSLYLILLY